MSYLIYIFSFIIISNFNFCTCAPVENWIKATNSEYQRVNDVFIGDVISLSENPLEYKFVVCEVFKGDLKAGQIIKGVNPKYCEPFVNKKGEWIFFGTHKSKFKQNECGLTFNISEPWGGRIFPPPPPPPNSNIDQEKQIKEWKKGLRKLVKEQIEILRQL